MAATLLSRAEDAEDAGRSLKRVGDLVLEIRRERKGMDGTPLNVDDRDEQCVVVLTR